MPATLFSRNRFVIFRVPDSFWLLRKIVQISLDLVIARMYKATSSCLDMFRRRNK